MDLKKAFALVRQIPKWIPTPEYIAEIKAGGRVTCAAVWDNLRPEVREEFRPDLNPNKRWFEQQAWKRV